MGQTQNTNGQLGKCVAIGLGVDQFIGPQHATGTRFVFNDNRAAQDARGTFSQCAHHTIGRAACWPWTYQFDGLRGKVALRHGWHGDADGACQAGLKHVATVEFKGHDGFQKT